MKNKTLLCWLLLNLAIFSGCQSRPKEEEIIIKQITSSAQNHELCMFGVFSPDDKWIVYTCGPNDKNDTIGKVNIETGIEKIIYKIDNSNEYGPGCGTASFADKTAKVVFIHGPFNSTKKRSYQFWRRAAAAIDENGQFYFIDARDVTDPFTIGALRGGTHCHQYSGDGQWLSFTYNDAIMAEIENTTGQKVNLRTIGVSKNTGEVLVDKNIENHNGKWFSALVVQVVPEPKYGTDQISRACNNGWVGTSGYQKQDGSWQRAIAFMGKTIDKDGNDLMEVYVVDIPEEINIARNSEKLEGTPTTMPGRPKGATQRRITYTENRKYPGISLKKRHWLKSSIDGSKIGYLAKDDNAIVQAFYVSPNGGKPVQITHEKTDVSSSIFWGPDGKYISYICDNSVFICRVKDGKSTRVTNKNKPVPKRAVWSHKGDKIAFARNVKNPENQQINSQIFVIEVPDNFFNDF